MHTSICTIVLHVLKITFAWSCRDIDTYVFMFKNWDMYLCGSCDRYFFFMCVMWQSVFVHVSCGDIFFMCGMWQVVFAIGYFTHKVCAWFSCKFEKRKCNDIKLGWSLYTGYLKTHILHWLLFLDANKLQTIIALFTVERKHCHFATRKISYV